MRSTRRARGRRARSARSWQSSCGGSETAPTVLVSAPSCESSSRESWTRGRPERRPPGIMREQLTLEPPVAAELAGSEDAVLKALEGHLGCDVFLRGNVLTLDGDSTDVAVGREVIRELSALIARGHE